MKTIVKFGILTFMILGLVNFVPDIRIISQFVGMDNLMICLVMSFSILFGIKAYINNELGESGYKYTTGLLVGLRITLIIVLIFGIVGGYMKWKYTSIIDGDFIHFTDSFFDAVMRYGLPGIILAFWIPYFNDFQGEKINSRQPQADLLDSDL